MAKAPGSPKRPYRGTVQAEVAALTRQRIIDAALALFAEQWADQIPLDQVAQRAGVTVQTVLRHFGSKDGLVAAAGQAATERAVQRRADTPAGDLAAAVQTVVEHYEDAGPRILRLLALEGRYPDLDRLAQAGRIQHRAWVERTFAPYVAAWPEAERGRLLADLVAICDVYVWKLLRLDQGLSRSQTETALREMLAGVLGSQPSTTGGKAK